MVGMLTSSSKLFFCFEQRSFKLRCETVKGIVLCYSHQACCLLHYLHEINYGIHIYQLTFELLHFCFRMWLWFRIKQKCWQIAGFGGKKAQIGGFAYPYSPPSNCHLSGTIV